MYLRITRTSPDYVHYVPTCLTCSRSLRAYVTLCFCFLRAFIFLHALRALRAFIFYLPYVLSFFYVPDIPSFFMCLHFLRAYISFIYVLVKLTQINKFTYDYSSLLLFNSAIYQRLSSVFTSIIIASCLAWFFLFMKRKILITLNAEEKTRPLETLEHYLELAIQGMSKSFTKKLNHMGIWLKAILQYCPEFFWLV